MVHRPIDLSTLPPELRRVVEQQLAKLPPAAREKLLREGSPIVERMLAKLQGSVPPPLPAAAQAAQQPMQHAAGNAAAAAERAREAAHQLARMLPKGHYNATIRPGDGPGLGRWVSMLLVGAVLVAIFWR